MSMKELTGNVNFIEIKNLYCERQCQKRDRQTDRQREENLQSGRNYL